LCDYNRNFTDVNSAVELAEAGPGVFQAVWLLSLALILKVINKKKQVFPTESKERH